VALCGPSVWDTGADMSYEAEQVQLQRDRLKALINKVPDRVAMGSIQSTRKWLETRERAEKLLKNPRATATQLMGMISQLQ
jgi:hypothetical protein